MQVKDFLTDLRKELLVFGIVSGISAFLIASTYIYYDQSYRAHRDASNDLDYAINQYNVAQDREQVLKIYEDRFSELIRMGIAGSEHRLNWIEVIKQFRSDNKIPTLAFNIFEQQKQEYENLKTDFQGVDVYSSRMKLDLFLGHEVDLIRLFKKLDESAEGLFMVSQCDISVSAPGGDIILDNSSRGNLSGSCELEWLTIRPEEANSIGIARR